MDNTLLEKIELVQESTVFADVDTYMTLANSYEKMLMMYQEAEMPEQLENMIPDSKYGDFLKKVYDFVTQLIEKIFATIDAIKLNSRYKKFKKLYAGSDKDTVYSPLDSRMLHAIGKEFSKDGKLYQMLTDIQTHIDNHKGMNVLSTELQRDVDHLKMKIDEMHKCRIQMRERIGFHEGKLSYVKKVNTTDIEDFLVNFMAGNEAVKRKLNYIKKQIRKVRITETKEHITGNTDTVYMRKEDINLVMKILSETYKLYAETTFVVNRMMDLIIEIAERRLKREKENQS